jgi:hypothetical protein
MKPYATSSAQMSRHTTRHRTALIAAAHWIFALPFAFVSQQARAADVGAAPHVARANPTVHVNVTEWVVLVADITNSELNARGLFHDSLPPFCEDLRTSPAPDKATPSNPGPIGMIRIAADGPLDKDDKLDVQLSFKQGRALGHWPRATVRSAGLLWQDLSLNPGADPRKLADDSWLALLRKGSLPLAAGKTSESFLLYDVEMSYPLSIQVKGGDGGTYTVAHGMDAPLRDVTLYKPAADGHWRSATIASLAKSSGFSKPAADTAAPMAKTEETRPAVVVTTAGGVVTRTIRKETVVTNRPAPVASIAGPDVKGTDFALGATAEAADTVLAPWRANLTNAGILDADQNAIIKILACYALDSKRLTIVYRIDPAELDRILPLEVVPQPKRISRIALVIVRGIDPGIGDELDELIKKLGDPSWKAREAATLEIKKIGPLAKSRLEKASNNSDPEIAYRAEQLLSGLSNNSGADAADEAAAPAAAAGGVF